jgi:hypothetical protein
MKQSTPKGAGHKVPKRAGDIMYQIIIIIIITRHAQLSHGAAA